jgi:sulfite exporter TauE/SafE/copper chaperone CopZ
MKTLVFHIAGMHCTACERLAEMELGEAPGVARVKASLTSETVEVTGDFGESTPEEVRESLGARVQRHGYVLAMEKPPVQAAKWSEFGVAVPAAVVFVAVFALLQEMGVGRLVTGARMGYGMAFVVGLVASVSSCIAIVGGLALSLSAFYAKEGDRVVPQVLFHAGRLGGFFVLGGLLGAVGVGFQPGQTGALIVGLAVSGVMIMMGIGLLDIFPWMKRWQPALPEVVGQKVRGMRGLHRGLMPLLAGVITFFLPCGFTQGMQLYTLTTGSFLTGALTMLCFALGTLPVLALVSFSPLELGKRGRSGVFFKTAGLLVIFFGLYTLFNSLAAYGIIRPLGNF